MKIKSSKLWIASIVALLSFGITLQFKSVLINGSLDSTLTARAEQLQVQLTTEKNKNEALYAQIISYKDEIQKYAEQAEENGGYAKILSQQLENASVIAGLTTVEGPGVTVTMSDSTMANTTGENENFFVIHDEDVLRVINELRDVGAEALSINGERILSTSEIRCSGSTVSVNNNRYSAPYVIKAIGNADEMIRALNMRQGVVEILAEWGIKVDVKKESLIRINGFTGSTEHKYAKPVKETSVTK